MVSSYQGLTQSDWLWKQTPDAFGAWKRIQMLAQCPNPDFLLLYQYNFQAPKPPTQKRIWPFQSKMKPQVDAAAHVQASLRGVAKEQLVCLMREPPLEELVARHQKKYQQAQKYCAYVSGPEEFAPIPDYMPAIWYVNVPFQSLDNMHPPEKVRACSWITSGVNRTENHRKRLDFLRLLKDADMSEIDVYGRDLPEWSGAKGSVNNKWHVMAPYWYNLAIENYADNQWYVSEKLWDALLAWCLPIYYGGVAADQLLPKGSFLRLPSLDEKGVQYIREVIASPDLWHERRDAIAEARQVILHKLNLLNWLSEYVENL